MMIFIFVMFSSPMNRAPALQFRELKPLQVLFAAYARRLVQWPSKLLVLLLTLALFGVSVYGNFYLRHEFDPMMFLPKDSYLMRFVDTRAE